VIFLKIVEKGNKIKVEYVGKLEDGTVFDSSEKHNSPLEFVVGEGQLIKGFDNAVVGMKIGEEKEVEIPPEEGYGNHNPEFVRDMPKDMFPKDQEIKPGMVFMVDIQDGRQIPVRVTKVSDENVTIDLNPPLAGQTLIFKIKVLEIA
jgi:FKBP-type peptidyl-prolyl cis-trans isomerase 2